MTDTRGSAPKLPTGWPAAGWPEPCGYCIGEVCDACFGRSRDCEHDVSDRHGESECTLPEDDR